VAGGAALTYASICAYAGSIVPGIGNLIGAGIGALVGAIAGGVYGHAMTDNGKLETELSQQLEQQAESARPAIIDAFNNTFRNFNNELEEALNLKLSTLEEQVRKVQSEKNEQRKDHMERQTHFQECSSRIDEILELNA
jgi:hypothetical protein